KLQAMRRLLFLIFAILLGVGAGRAEDLTPGMAYLMIKKVRPTVTEPDGWASDLLDVMKAQTIPPTRENVCAAIAVIDQESNFVANPVVQGLGELADKALREKMAHYPIIGALVLEFLDTHPQGDTSYLQRIRRAKTERDLDLTYRAMVNDAGTASNMSLFVQSGLFNRMIEERNNISTVGSMQVSVGFAMNEAKSQRYLPMTLSDAYALRDELYTRRGGVYYGVKQLLGYDTGYSQKIFRFADYNAGRYSSRNAAFQHIISTLTKQTLARDGDLLLYGKDGTALPAVSSSEKALRGLSSAENLGFSDKQIRDDLLLEKQDGFATSGTYLAVKNLYQRKTGKPAAFAELPGIDLKSPKLAHKMTTASYAASVDRRYQKCLSVK
ncbi:MAG: DUF1615 family protein, partial [Aestuariivirga sp.]